MAWDRRSVLVGSAAALAASVSPAMAQTAIPTAVREGRITVRGRTLGYRAETGERVMTNPVGQPRATIFSVAYLEKGANPKTRPVSFVWNGGPGGASWHLREHLSPKMTVAAQMRGHYAFVPNPDSPIDVTDLVFIDAPGTGYSRFFTEDAKPEYWGVEEDGHAFADFIAGWLADHGRLGSPVFLIGESYGGTRAGQIAKFLATRPRPVGLAGVALISPTLGSGGPPTPPQPILALPSLAAVAHYHKRGAYAALPLDKVVADAEAFAAGPYARMLAQGQVTEANAELVANFVGLPRQVVLDARLTPSLQQFRTSLIPGERLDGGDGREHRIPPPPAQDTVVTANDAYDLHASIVGLLTDELGYTPAGPYVRDPVEANRRWNQKLTGPAYTPEILRTLPSKPKVFLVAGWYDLIVPYLTPVTALSAAGLGDRLEFHVYPTGHGVYEDLASRPTATDDLRAFYRLAARA